MTRKTITEEGAGSPLRLGHWQEIVLPSCQSSLGWLGATGCEYANEGRARAWPFLRLPLVFEEARTTRRRGANEITRRPLELEGSGH
jgi:hypothetical protein